MRKFLLSAVMMLMVALYAQIANATTLSLPCTGTNSTPGTFQDLTCTFTLPSGKSFTGLSGKFSITQSNGAGNLGEALLLLWTAPSGQTCDLAHRESPGFGAYIVKTMNANGTQDTGDISLSEVTNEGVRLNDGCVILYMSAGSTSGSLRATSTLVLTYATPPNAETTDGLGGEEYFDSSLHANGDFAYVWVAPSAVTVDKLRGNVSDAAYNDVGVTWTIQHDFYYYAASDCTAQFGGVTGEYGPGSYYSNIPGSAVHLFQAGSNSGVHKDAHQHLINNNLNQSVAAGGCIVALSKQTSGTDGAGIDDELQVSVDYH